MDTDRLERSLPPSERFDSQQVRRTSAPSTVRLHDKGLGGRIGRDNEASGMSSARRRRLVRQRRQDTRAEAPTKVAKNQRYALGEVHRICSALELPSSVDREASRLCQEAHEAELFVGVGLDRGAAAAVYASCRLQAIIRPVTAIAGVARADAEAIVRVYRKLAVRLDLATPLITPSDWIPQFADEADVPDKIHQEAMQWPRRAAANEVQFGGAKPSGIAAACLYLAGRPGITQEQMGAVADVAPVTIRKRVADLEAIAAES